MIEIRYWCKFLVFQVLFVSTRIILMTLWTKGVTIERNRRMAAKRGKTSEFGNDVLNRQGVLTRSD